MKNIKGLKVVCGELKNITADSYGAIIYDSEKNSVHFEGYWYKGSSVSFSGLRESEKIYLVDSPMTMRGLTKMIAKDFDYELYIKMDLEDKGLI